jgi:hypothetical protein
MNAQRKSAQQGMTFIGLIFYASIFAMAGVVAAQVFPTVVEYYAVGKAVNKAASGASVAEVRSIFDKAAAIDDIKSIAGKDIEVTKEGDKVVVSFAYEREIHLTGPAFLTIKYAGRSK